MSAIAAIRNWSSCLPTVIGNRSTAARSGFRRDRAIGPGRRLAMERLLDLRRGNGRVGNIVSAVERQNRHEVQLGRLLHPGSSGRRADQVISPADSGSADVHVDQRYDNFANAGIIAECTSASSPILAPASRKTCQTLIVSRDRALGYPPVADGRIRERYDWPSLSYTFVIIERNGDLRLDSAVFCGSARAIVSPTPRISNHLSCA